jgi:TatD DNase family protein
MIDTHAHLYKPYYTDNIHEIVQKALSAGVEKIFLPNINAESVPFLLEICQQYPTVCFPMLGLHPCDVNQNFETELALLEKYLDNPSFCAIGEIGMDLYHDLTFKKDQEKAFFIQLDWAVQKQLPINIHARNANSKVLELLKSFGNASIKGIFHCFSGTVDQAEKIIEMGFLLGIGGVVTYKNSGLDKIVAHVGVENIVLETDAPYLSPAPLRGKTNEPSYLIHIAQKIADITQRSLEDVKIMTTHNAIKIYNKLY